MLNINTDKIVNITFKKRKWDEKHISNTYKDQNTATE